MSITTRTLSGLKALLRGVGLEVSRVHSPGLRLERLEWLRAHDIRTVLDVGANSGQFAALVRHALPDAFIYSFEPIAAVYAELVENMRGDTRFEALPFALGSDERQLPINRNEFTPSSSLLPMDDLHRKMFPFAVATTTETVNVRRLDDVRTQLRLEPGLMIKVDVQGYEEHVIRGGKATFAQADVVLIEVGIEPLYAGQWLFAEVHEALRELGFSFKGISGQLLRPDNGAPLQADVIFARRTARGSDRH